MIAGEAIVAAIAPDGAGGWYVGGSFTDVGDQHHPNLAHIRGDGTVEQAFDPAPDGDVTGLVVAGGKLYVTGSFTHVGGAARAGLAALDLATGSATGWAPQPDGGVRALLEHDGTLYVGGDFTHIVGQQRSGLAAFRLADGALTGFAPAINGSVTALAAGVDRLYVSGDFTAPRPHLAAFRLDGSVDGGWQPVAQASARQLLFVAPDRVYVMSRGAQHFERGVAYGAVVDAATGAGIYDETFLWGPGVAALDGTRLLTSGFRWEGPAPSEQRASEGIFTRQLGTPTAPQFLARGLDLASVSAIVPLADGGALVGAGFRSLGGVRRDNLAAVDLTTGRATDWNPGSTHQSAAVRALVVAGDTVFAGGAFSSAGGAPNQRVVALDKASGAARAWPLDADGDVRALAVAGDTAYVATLTCSPGIWAGATAYALQWVRDFTQVTAEGAAYTVTDADAGHRLTCRVTATGPGGWATADAEHLYPMWGRSAAPSPAPPTASPPARDTGTRGADVVTGRRGADQLDGGAGNDRLDGGAGNDKLTGGAGSDTLLGGLGGDVLDGGLGADRLDGGAGADRLAGGAGDDRLAAGAGPDRLVGGPGRDILEGGAGRDVLDARDGRPGDRVTCGRDRDSALVDPGDRVKGDCNASAAARSPSHRARAGTDRVLDRSGAGRAGQPGARRG